MTREEQLEAAIRWLLRETGTELFDDQAFGEGLRLSWAYAEYGALVEDKDEPLARIVLEIQTAATAKQVAVIDLIHEAEKQGEY